MTERRKEEWVFDTSDKQVKKDLDRLESLNRRVERSLSVSEFTMHRMIRP